MIDCNIRDHRIEHHPIRWTQGNIVIEMAYDRMGRRIVYHETRNDANYINAKFVYNGYLCIQRLYGASNGVYQSFVWDPTEQVATRPLCMQVPSWGATVFYMHDGNKNVSDVIYYTVANGIAAHYDYAPFGAVTRTARDTRMTGRDFIGENPFRFSSEYHDNTLGLVYYNYRHYNPLDGRWCGRDPIGENKIYNLFSYCNNINYCIDYLGLEMQSLSVKSSDIKWETKIVSSEFLRDSVKDQRSDVSPAATSNFSFKIKGTTPNYNEDCKICEINVTSIDIVFTMYLLSVGTQKDFYKYNGNIVDVYISQEFIDGAKMHEKMHLNIYENAILSQNPYQIESRQKVQSEEECHNIYEILSETFRNNIIVATNETHNIWDRLEGYEVVETSHWLSPFSKYELRIVK